MYSTWMMCFHLLNTYCKAQSTCHSSSLRIKPFVMQARLEFELNWDDLPHSDSDPISALSWRWNCILCCWSLSDRYHRTSCLGWLERGQAHRRLTSGVSATGGFPILMYESRHKNRLASLFHSRGLKILCRSSRIGLDWDHLFSFQWIWVTFQRVRIS